MKRKIFALAMVIVMALSLASCGKDTTGGLGTLSIDSDSGSKTSSNSGVPDLNGGKSSTATPTGTATEPTTSPTSVPDSTPTSVPDSTPTSVPEPTPAPQTTFQTQFYNDQFISATIPAGWNVNCQAYNDGTGNYRMAICISDPMDSNTQITFFTALEPFWTSESDKNLMAPLMAIGPYCPVINEVSASAVLGQWSNVYKCLAISDVTYPKISATVPDIVVGQIAGTSTPVNDGTFTSSEVLAACSIPGASQAYAVYFSNSMGKLVFPYYGISYYVSYANFLISAREEVYETYLPAMLECAKTFDFTGFNSYNKKNRVSLDDVSSNDDLICVSPDITLDATTLKLK